jgi:hypothetical protein
MCTIIEHLWKIIVNLVAWRSTIHNQNIIKDGKIFNHILNIVRWIKLIKNPINNIK